MAYNQLSSYKTTVSRDSNGKMRVVYHTTPIVVFGGGEITLNSGGWHSVTTKRKMNQASHQFGLGYGVYQKDFEWFVDLPNGKTVKFIDGMTFNTN